jgi:Bacterial Ig-like domain (group 2)
MKTVLFVLCAVAVAGCSRDLTGNGEIHPVCASGGLREVSVTPASATLNKGDRITLSAPTFACYGRVLWSSSKASVATVDSTGLVQAVDVGQATIIATSALDPTVKGAALINVNTGVQGSFDLTVVSITDVAKGAPATLSSLNGLVDVLISTGSNFDQSLAADLIINAGQDTVVTTVDSPTPPPAKWEPTLRWNTAQVPNGNYTIKVRVRFKSGASVTSTRTQVTVKNP